MAVAVLALVRQCALCGHGCGHTRYEARDNVHVCHDGAVRAAVSWLQPCLDAAAGGHACPGAVAGPWYGGWWACVSGMAGVSALWTGCQTRFPAFLAQVCWATDPRSSLLKKEAALTREVIRFGLTAAELLSEDLQGHFLIGKL